jgi:hypothetical protein
MPNTICGRWIYALSDSCLFHSCHFANYLAELFARYLAYECYWRDAAQLTSLSPKHCSNLVVTIIKT